MILRVNWCLYDLLYRRVASYNARRYKVVNDGRVGGRGLCDRCDRPIDIEGFN